MRIKYVMTDFVFIDNNRICVIIIIVLKEVDVYK